MTAMKLPFTPEQFFDVFRQYNEAVWPAQIALNLFALVAVGLVIWRRPFSDRAISGILALLWAWTGVAYHLLFFTAINKAAIVFGTVFLLGSGVFLFAGVIKGQLKFSSDNLSHHILGAVLVAFSLVIYPILAELLGHGYPAMPTFGLPCPTTIFTIGVLCFLTTPFPRYILVAPILWSAVGSQAAFLLGVYQDLGLLVAGIVAAYLVVVAPRIDATSA
jgi:hypothetical protein